MIFVIASKVLGDGPREEEDEYNGGGDPKGPVQVGISVQDVEEGSARIEG